MSDHLKDIGIVLAGVINSALPAWVSLIPEALPIVEATLRTLVALATIGFLIHRTMYYRKKTRLLNKDSNNDRDDE